MDTLYNLKGIFFGVLALLNLWLGEVCIVTSVKNMVKISRNIILNTIDNNLLGHTLYFDAVFYAIMGIIAIISGCYILVKEHNKILGLIGKFVRSFLTF